MKFSSPHAKTIFESLRVVLSPAYTYELRALGADRSGTVSGYFDGQHLFEMAEAAADLSGDAEGVYVTINPVNAELIARAYNRCKTWAKHTTSDNDIVGRRFVPLDFDVARPAGISSTDGEHQAALERAAKCLKWLLALGFSANSLVPADSGNGAHVLVRIRLQNNAESTELIKRCLEAIALQFSGNGVDVDLKTYNAARVWKVYGSLAAKGDSTEKRPHRLAKIISAPKELVVAPRDLLENLAAMAPAEQKPPMAARRYVGGNGSFDLEAWITTHNLPVVEQKPWQGGKAWILNPCPWNPAHTNRAAHIIQFPSGAIAAGCHHNGCVGKGWAELRKLYEPEYQPHNASSAVPPGVAPPMFNDYRRALRAKRK